MQVNLNVTSFDQHVVFAEDEIVIVKTALKSKLYKQEESEEVRTGKFQVMLTALSEKFGIPEVRLVKDVGNMIGATFDPEANKIHAQRFSLVSIVMAFGAALLFHKNQNLADGAEPLRLDVLCFGLCAFKQAAPQMFETARAAGRLVIPGGAPYTGDGSLGEDPEDDDVDTTSDEDVPPMRPDIDPENRPDRGNGHGED